MVKPCDQPLRPNPYKVDRDPKTGRWIVILAFSSHFNQQTVYCDISKNSSDYCSLNQCFTSKSLEQP